MSKIPEYSRLHCYFGCDEGGPLHHFPKPHNVERFAAWKAVLYDESQEKSNMYIYNTYKLCNKHFEKYYILPSNQLTRNAVPTLFLEHNTQANNQISVLQTSAELGPATHNPEQAPHNPEPATSKCLESGFLPSTRFSKQKNCVQGGTNKKIIQQLNKKVFKLTQKSKNLTKQIKEAKKISETKSFLKIVEHMPDMLQTFVKMQMKFNKKPKGRKFTLDEKIMAASIWKQSQKGYNYLRKYVILPSKRTLQRLISAFSLNPGINENIMQVIKRGMKNLPIEKRLFTLLFDEVALAPGLYFNNDKITGFEDFGKKTNQNIADHALVLMIKGIKSKIKLPILFTFCRSTTKKYDLKSIIKSTIEKLTGAGAIVVATICDQAASNVGTIKMLIKETKEKYLRKNEVFNSNAFEINGLKIFPLFDTPHLLKGIRNNFMNKNIIFTQNNCEKQAKWEHLKMLLEADKGEDEIRILNKLTEYHVDPNKVPKMKVKYAAQVFSQRVSAVMRFLSKHNILPKECEDTADLLITFDKLFDSFNGHLYHDTTKVLKGCLKKNSPHFKFWNEILPILKSIKFEKIIKNIDGTITKKYENVPSVQNWIHNINTFPEMWTHINEKYKVKNILTRNFNQDPLENFFCCIRSNGYQNTNPTCLQFVNAYKTLLLNNMNSPHSINANCENDDYKPLKSMKFLLSQKCDEKTPDFACEIDSLIIAMNEIVASNSIVHDQSKKYVAGYVIKKCKTNVFKKCVQCHNDLVKEEIDPDSFNYAIDYTKKSLFHANDSFVRLLNEIYFMIVTCLRETPEIEQLKQKIIFCINCRCDFSLISCTKHKSDLIDYIINLSINLIVNSWCKGINRILSGKIISFDNNDKIKLQAFNYYKSHKKRH